MIPLISHFAYKSIRINSDNKAIMYEIFDTLC